MASAALTEWNTERTARIDDLLYAHRQTGGAGRGRRWRTEQLNWALVLRVAAEFQGFARALHDEAVDYFTSQVGYLNASLSSIVRTRMLVLRDLDRGNASPGALGSDFGRLGMSLWPELNARYTRAASWNATLEALNTARNGIAHDDQAKFAKLHAEGWNLRHLATINRFRSAADSLAPAMDTVVGSYLERLFGMGRPW